MSDLLALAERCEAATGPDRELDALIFIATEWPTYRLQTHCGVFPGEVRPGRIQEGDGFGWREAPHFTASLDAAMTLLPGRDWEWSLEWESSSGIHDMIAVAKIGDPRLFMEATAATPALALCAAALRAREQS